MFIIEIIKSVLLGIIEGITEWLPVSSTGHLLLFDSIIPLAQSETFRNMLVEVIQFGAIIAVVILFFNRLNPFSRKKSSEEKKATWTLLFKILVAVIPGFVAVIVKKILHIDLQDNPFVIAGALLVYGVLFIIIERLHKDKEFRINSSDDIDYKTAFLIGMFQVLSLVPGTSRSGSTILGAMILGVSRTAAADYSFFLAIPATAGASLMAALDYIEVLRAPESTEIFGAPQIILLAVASVVAFVVSYFAVKFLMSFVRRHSFEAFGWYRIALAVLVFVFFSVVK